MAWRWSGVLLAFWIASPAAANDEFGREILEARPGGNSPRDKATPRHEHTNGITTDIINSPSYQPVMATSTRVRARMATPDITTITIASRPSICSASPRVPTLIPLPVHLVPSDSVTTDRDDSSASVATTNTPRLS
jgi:hypothetical protein